MKVCKGLRMRERWRSAKRLQKEEAGEALSRKSQTSVTQEFRKAPEFQVLRALRAEALSGNTGSQVPGPQSPRARAVSLRLEHLGSGFKNQSQNQHLLWHLSPYT